MKIKVVLKTESGGVAIEKQVEADFELFGQASDQNFAAFISTLFSAMQSSRAEEKGGAVPASAFWVPPLTESSEAEF